MGVDLRYSVICRACQVRRTVNGGGVCAGCIRRGKDPEDYRDARRPYRRVAPSRAGKPRPPGHSEETANKVVQRYLYLLWHHRGRYDREAGGPVNVRGRVASEFNLTINQVNWIMTCHRKREREQQKEARRAAAADAGMA